MDDLIKEFLTETGESLSELDNAVVLLEQNPQDMDLLSKIFRVMHTIKGTCGFLGLPRLEKVAHKTEDLLGLFREEKLQANPAYVSLILEALDAIKFIVATIEATTKEPEGDDTDLIHRLEHACGGIDGGADFTNNAADIFDTAAIEPAAEEFPDNTPTPKPVVVAQTPTAQAADHHSPAESSLASQSLRVNVGVLEDLMTMVSELVLTRNQLLQISRSQKDSELSPSLQRLNHIVSDLQEGVMKTRMQPIGNAWAKLPRIVRDISSELGKKIELDMHGQDTELDRQVLEMIKDPLTHMVRNSADHGIETPDERLANGKNETGRIRLSSWHEGGHIMIEISDDGKGLPIERIKNKILQNGLANEAELAAMSSLQIQQYIFHAGFSTADKITSVSGRGVGMDVVRSNIEKISGSIEMTSIEGKGTTFSIKIPLTLAIVSALIVGVGNERYAIPQLDVRELVMVGAQSGNRIEMINDAPVYRLRDRLLPLINMNSLLTTPGNDSNLQYIAVIKVGNTNFGLIVDRVFDTEEIVVKPVASLLRNLPVFSGNTILGDGQVIMILDPSGIMKYVGLAANAGLSREQEDALLAQKETREEIPLLLFHSGSTALKAVPLKHVSRLEEIDLANIEMAGSQRVIQYRDALMPLYLSNDQPLAKEGRAPVIVFSTSDGLAGLIVDRILDITAFYGDFQITSTGRLAGSAIIDGQTTDILNLSFHEKTDHTTPTDTRRAEMDFIINSTAELNSLEHYGAE